MTSKKLMWGERSSDTNKHKILTLELTSRSIALSIFRKGKCQYVADYDTSNTQAENYEGAKPCFKDSFNIGTKFQATAPADKISQVKVSEQQLNDIQTICSLEGLQGNEFEHTHIVCTHTRGILVPASLYHPGDASAYLQVNGIPIPVTHKAVAAPAVADKVAAFALENNLIQLFGDTFGYSQTHYLHPLQIGAAILTEKPYRKGAVVFLNFSAQWVHLLFQQNGTLQQAETLPYTTPAEVVFYIRKLVPESDLTLFSSGVNRLEIGKQLRPFFPHATFVELAPGNTTPKNYPNLTYFVDANY